MKKTGKFRRYKRKLLTIGYAEIQKQFDIEKQSNGIVMAFANKFRRVKELDLKIAKGIGGHAPSAYHDNTPNGSSDE